jgi:hypothetical protein
MGVLNWLLEYGLGLVQTVGIVGGLLFTAHAISKDETARTITNTIAINEQYSNIWKNFYERPELARILQKDADLIRQPVSNNEALFVKTLLLHLDVVRRAMKVGIFVKIQGLQTDIQDFFTLPIPKAVWEKIKPFQDEEFVGFIEDCLKG